MCFSSTHAARASKNENRRYVGSSMSFYRAVSALWHTTLAIKSAKRLSLSVLFFLLLTCAARALGSHQPLSSGCGIAWQKIGHCMPHTHAFSVFLSSLFASLTAVFPCRHKHAPLCSVLRGCGVATTREPHLASLHHPTRAAT
jgi:hypothetical protein